MTRAVDQEVVNIHRAAKLQVDVRTELKGLSQPRCKPPETQPRGLFRLSGASQCMNAGRNHHFHGFEGPEMGEIST